VAQKLHQGSNPCLSANKQKFASPSPEKFHDTLIIYDNFQLKKYGERNEL
jgi:hypothetical protein